MTENPEIPISSDSRKDTSRLNFPWFRRFPQQWQLFLFRRFPISAISNTNELGYYRPVKQKVARWRLVASHKVISLWCEVNLCFFFFSSKSNTRKNLQRVVFNKPMLEYAPRSFRCRETYIRCMIYQKWISYLPIYSRKKLGLYLAFLIFLYGF